ncbi:hypothetical protein PIB30_048194 [Stylosanthes scabra]|uniref:Uncharacterized protein n=1 Tax=Stylosanthes scabra TaxID=79078 RepID=A0ABU6YFR0_9FABA|nr:hypothetical protein [Stylosanthes scabra]
MNVYPYGQLIRSVLRPTRPGPLTNQWTIPLKLRPGGKTEQRDTLQPPPISLVSNLYFQEENRAKGLHYHLLPSLRKLRGTSLYHQEENRAKLSILTFIVYYPCDTYALIDMESGELMLRIHDECLIINIYKSMHSSSGTKTCMKINSVDRASTKPPDKQTKASAENFCPSPSQQKEEATISPILAEKEKKKTEPAAYMPKPLYPQRLKAENKNKAPKKEPKEENTTNDSMKFQLIEKVPYLPTIMGSNNKTYMITKGVCNKFFELP